MGTTLKALLLPGGLLLLVVAVLAHTGLLALAPQSLSFLYYCALAGGMLLAWRFHSSRIFFSLLVLFLAQQATAIFGSAHAIPGTPGWTAMLAVVVLVPLNFVLIATMHERGFIVSGTAPVGLFLFVQIVLVAVLGNVSQASPSAPIRAHRTVSAGSWPEYVWVILIGAGVLLLVRSLMTHKPADGALFWCLCSFSLSLYFIGVSRFSIAYSATAATILAASIVENSYLLAYHDELTTLPSRRAFNDALLRLQEPFAIAVVDVDHFKRFNDTYGHDTGDQVLRLVAGNLSRVTGGGHAYRCGGEEFMILFPGKTISDVAEHLELLRQKIESSQFHQRSDDRRRARRGESPEKRERRNQERRSPTVRRRARTGDAIRQLAQNKPAAPLSVTVSIGVAASTARKPHPDLVMDEADKALYRAKAGGRNRVETAAPARRRGQEKAAGIA